MGTYKIHLAGESFGSRQKHIQDCWEGQEVIFKREPDNPHSKDGSAILVIVEGGADLGYIGRENSTWIAEIIDAERPIKAEIMKIIGGTHRKPSYGVVLEVYTGSEVSRFRPVKGHVKGGFIDTWGLWLVIGGGAALVYFLWWLLKAFVKGVINN